MKILMLFISFFIVTHDYYVSITEINHNAEMETLEIGVKIFADDVENAILKSDSVKLNIGEMFEHESTDKYLSQYLNEHLKIKVNGKMITMQFLGHEMEKKNAVWCFMEAFDVDVPESLEIENTILIQEFEEQKNIVYYGKSRGATPHTLIMGKDKTKEHLRL